MYVKIGEKIGLNKKM